MRSAQLMNRIHIAAILSMGLAFPSAAYSQSPSPASKNARPATTTSTPRTSTAAVKNATVKKTSSTGSGNAGVQKASASAPNSSAVPAVHVATPSRSASSNVRRTSSSEVTQAACKSCQANSPSISSMPAETIYEGEVFDSGSAIHHAESYQFGGECDSCGPQSACGPSQGCGPANVVHPVGVLGALLRNSQVRVEAATFWGDKQRLSPLVTTRRPANDPATDGLIGRSDTIALFGGGETLKKGVQGLRGEVGFFFTPCRDRGIMLRMFDASTESLRYDSAATFESVVMRPFFSTDTNAQSTIAINYPGSVSGSIVASLESDVYGGDLLYRTTLHQEVGARFEFLAGYQMMRLEEGLSLVSTTTALSNTGAPTGATSALEDRFTTSNRFHGAAFGLNSVMRDGCWTFSTLAKLGLGNVQRKVGIHGNSTITVPGNPPSVNASTNGLLARSTNEGDYETDTFVVAPEIGLSLGYRITPGLQATVGYSFLTLPKVARVGDQLDPQLAANLSNPPTGAATPRYSLVETNYSLHSLSYGLQWRY